MRLIVTFLAVIACALLVSAQISPPSVPTGDEVNFIMVLYDSSTKTLIDDMHANVNIKGDGALTKTLKFVQHGNLKLQLAPGRHEIKLFLDDINTPGKDYTYSAIFDVDERSEDVFLVPSGSLQGTVYHSGAAVPDADVRAYCSGNSEPAVVKTDFSGFFIADWLPIGQCHVVAANEDFRGETTAKINHGRLSEIELALSENVSERPNWLYILSAFAVVAVAGSLFMIFFRRPKSKRSADVIGALNAKEKRVVSHLVNNSGRSTQAAIKNDTGIPKTTLLRIFQSLEARNIINIEKIGKMKKITLTDWFLGKGKLDQNPGSEQQKKTV